jgi:hypothetical protein
LSSLSGISIGGGWEEVQGGPAVQMTRTVGAHPPVETVRGREFSSSVLVAFSMAIHTYFAPIKIYSFASVAISVVFGFACTPYVYKYKIF